MHHFQNFIQKLLESHKQQAIQQGQIDELLDNSRGNRAQLDEIEHTISNLQKEVTNLNEQVQHLREKLSDIDLTVHEVSDGTRIELFETLQKMRSIYVIHKRQASPAEKKEATELYNIYHTYLHGNGQGERYYQEIIALPESEEELEEIGRRK